MKRFLTFLACGLMVSLAVAAPKRVVLQTPKVTNQVTNQERLEELFEISDNEERDTEYGTWPTIGQNRNSAMQVRAVQYLLRAHGYKVSVDGVFGKQTRATVAKFQHSHADLVSEDYDPRGVVDDFTWEALIMPVKRNSSGAAVSGVQSLLRARGYATPLNGLFGPRTLASVRAFQKENKLKVDGIVGGKTWCRLVGGTTY